MRLIAIVMLAVIYALLNLAFGVPMLMVGATIGTALATETLKTLAEAARTLPGGPVHVSTIHRWRLKGVRGVRLETILRGGIRCTTDEAIARFFTATTASADGETPPARTSAKRDRDIRQAEIDCERSGI